MAKNLDLTGKVKIDGADKAASQLQDIAEAGEKVEQPIELTVEARVDRALGSLDEVATDARKAAEAAEALGRALGPELAGKADLGRIVAGFEKAGLSLEEVTANADKLGAKLRDIAGSGGGGLDQIGARARATADDTDKLSDSARGANSALANMVGNTAQDLGALGGVAGSAGVAVGQMAEYFSDAALGGEKASQALRSMLGVAGPIALLSGIVATFSGVMSENAAAAEASARRVERFGDAMEGTADDVVGISQVLRDSAQELRNFATESATFGGRVDQLLSQIGRNIPIIGSLFGQAGSDIIDMAERAGISIYEMSARVEGGAGSVDSLRQKLNDAAASGRLTTDEVEAFYGALDKMSLEARKAASAQGLFNVTADEANAILGELAAKADPLAQLGDVWAVLFRDMADGTIDTEAAADAVNRLAEELGLTQEEVIGLAQQHMADEFEKAQEAAQATADAMSEVQDAFAGTAERVDALGRTFDTLNASTPLAFADRAADTVQSFDDLKDSLQAVQDIGSKPLAPTAVEDLRGLSDESAAVIDAMGGMRDAIQGELVAALEGAGGNFDAFRSKASFFREEVTSQFTEAFRQMGLGPDQVDEKVTELLGNLGLLPSQVETQIRLTQADEAMRKIELFGDALGNLPPEVQAQVAASIDANDPVKAWEQINAGVQAQGAIPVDTEADPQGFSRDMDKIEGGQYDAEVDIGANPKPGQQTVDRFTSTKRETDPVKVDANTQAAIGTMIYLKVLAALLQPVVRVDADTAGARSEISGLGNMRPRVPVNAYLSDYPSAGEIARAIGTVRVPVVAETQRLTGAR